MAKTKMSAAFYKLTLAVFGILMNVRLTIANDDWRKMCESVSAIRQSSGYNIGYTLKAPADSSQFAVVVKTELVRLWVAEDTTLWMAGFFEDNLRIIDMLGSIYASLIGVPFAIRPDDSIAKRDSLLRNAFPDLLVER